MQESFVFFFVLVLLVSVWLGWLWRSILWRRFGHLFLVLWLSLHSWRFSWRHWRVTLFDSVSNIDITKLAILTDSKRSWPSERFYDVHSIADWVSFSAYRVVLLCVAADSAQPCWLCHSRHRCVLIQCSKAFKLWLNTALFFDPCVSCIFILNVVRSYMRSAAAFQHGWVDVRPVFKRFELFNALCSIILIKLHSTVIVLLENIFWWDLSWAENSCDLGSKEVSFFSRECWVWLDRRV